MGVVIKFLLFYLIYAFVTPMISINELETTVNAVHYSVNILLRFKISQYFYLYLNIGYGNSDVSLINIICTNDEIKS